jgi:hypothetical protein
LLDGPVSTVHFGSESSGRSDRFTPDDVFKSTVHRAINRSGVERYSIPLFFGTDYDVPLEVSIGLCTGALGAAADQLSFVQALPSCVSEDFPPQYEVIKAGDYVKSRLEATYAQSKK